MAQWISHLIVADQVLESLPMLCRHEFCVGNIAPDCNLVNDDWTVFTPSREITHWMNGNRKDIADAAAFYNEYIIKRLDTIHTKEELSFLLGYYSHLVTDAILQMMIRDENRIQLAWNRIQQIPDLQNKIDGMDASWDNIKKIISKEERMKDFYSFEREYLDSHPHSGYFTEIQNLTSFPDYIDYLPKGAIAIKVKKMFYIPSIEYGTYPYIAFSKEEYLDFLNHSIQQVIQAIQEIVYEKCQ